MAPLLDIMTIYLEQHCSKNENKDTAYNVFSNLFRSNASLKWTSVDLHHKYAKPGGTKLTRSKIGGSIFADFKMESSLSFLSLGNSLILKYKAN